MIDCFLFIYITACEMINQYHTGERSPDSGSEFPLRQSVIRSKGAFKFEFSRIKTHTLIYLFLY